ncbi:MAG: hypothetical protein ACR2PS_18300, partial [Pseudomonadales bacterium]
MFANHNNLYLIGLVCILALFIASLVHLRSRDKKTWKTLILLSGALLAAMLITAQIVADGEFSPILFAPGLGVSAAALVGLLVATLFGPQKPTLAFSGSPVLQLTVADDAQEGSEQNALARTSAGGSKTIDTDYRDPQRPNHEPLGTVSAGNVSLIKINADLEAASNDGGLEHYSDIDESIVPTTAESNSLDVHPSVGSNDELSTDAPDATAADTRWKAPVTSLHERRAPAKNSPSIEASSANEVRTELKSDSLDLSETERLFRDMREEVQGVDLPDNEQWIAEAAITRNVDLSDEQIIDHEQNAAISQGADITEAIMDAELIDDDEALDPDATLNFGDDQTGEYARPEANSHPQSEASATHLPSNSIVNAPIPDTLDEALLAAKRSASELKVQVEKLNTGIDSFNALRDQQLLDATRDQLN